MNLAFIHIPKNAGNTVRETLNLRNLAITERWNPQTLTEGHVSFGHTPLSTALELMSDEFRAESFKFAFCRNPFDRAISMWTFNNKVVLGFEPTKKRFLEYTKVMQEERDRHAVLRTQSYWLEGGWEDLNYIGKVENMEEDLRTVAAWGNVDITIDIPKSNAGKHGPYQQYYCQQSIDNILKMYECDFERFNYSEKVYT